ncbi:MAG: M56 family metallopeptidase [bacterium]|nr:M56 family metallopeptidase [bacterium]
MNRIRNKSSISGQRKSYLRFFYSLATTIVLFAGFSFYIILRDLPYLQVVFQQFGHQVVEACGCSQYIAANNISIVSLGLILVAVLIVFFVGLFIYRVGATILRTLKYRKSLHNKILRVTYFKSIPIYRIESSELLAVTVGFLKPAVYISNSLEQVLSPNELWAVIKHELSHALNKDPMYQSVLSAMKIFFPFNSRVLQYYRAVPELIADEYVADDENLKKALLKVIDQPPSLSNNFGVTYFSVTDARINRLLGNQAVMPRYGRGLAVLVVTALLLTIGSQAFGSEEITLAIQSCLEVQQMCEEVMSAPLMSLQ